MEAAEKSKEALNFKFSSQLLKRASCSSNLPITVSTGSPGSCYLDMELKTGFEPVKQMRRITSAVPLATWVLQHF